MNNESEASKIMNEFVDQMEQLMDATKVKLDKVDKDAMTIGEVARLESRSDALQEKFESVGM